MRMRTLLPWLATAGLVLGVASAAGCQQPDGRSDSVPAHDSASAPAQDAGPSSGPPTGRDIEALVAHLDSGSQAFAEGRLQEARRHHLLAVELAPELTSAWFGLFMVEDSLGNEAAADSALARVRRISPGAIPPELQDRLPPAGQEP